MAKAKSPRRSPAGQAINEILELRDDQSQVSAELATSAQKDDDTRQEVAKKFVRYYFLLLTLIILGVPAYNALIYTLTHNNDLIISLKDTILTYSAVVGPTVGLVVAYYFKSRHD